MTKNEVTLKDIYELIEKLRKEIAENYVSKKEFEPVVNNYVNKDEFDPVKRLVYGVVGLVLMAVFTALVALVIKG